MSRGFLLFAHNNSEIDYVKLASICASRIKKFTNKPVALVTDSKIESPVFDHVIYSPVDKSNKRTLNNKVQYFYNISRLDSFRLSPFDETIVVDVDYLVNSTLLDQYFGSDESFLMAKGVKNLHDAEHYGPMPGLKMKWATTLYFKKDKIAETIFNQAKLVKENYNFYKQLYKFDVGNFRNDYAFTIAEHIVKGTPSHSLPEITFLVSPLDTILRITNQDRYVCLVNNTPCVLNGIDLHFFNKQTILDFEKELTC